MTFKLLKKLQIIGQSNFCFLLDGADYCVGRSFLATGIHE